MLKRNINYKKKKIVKNIIKFYTKINVFKGHRTATYLLFQQLYFVGTTTILLHNSTKDHH